MNRLREIREDKDLRQVDIAKEINIPQKTYSNYETGINDIPTDILKALANYYNVSIDYLLYQTDVRKRYPKSILK